MTLSLSSAPDRASSCAAHLCPRVSWLISSGEMNKEMNRKVGRLNSHHHCVHLRYVVSYAELCSSHPAISAVQDFSKGVACGKRDSRWVKGELSLEVT